MNLGQNSDIEIQYPINNDMDLVFFFYFALMILICWSLLLQVLQCKVLFRLNRVGSTGKLVL